LYLNLVGYDLEAAIEAYKDDERWEKAQGKGKTRQSVGRRRFTGQK
jgi:hypothetical protein